MSKGLKLTLLTVAVALIGMRATAMAPVINDIPSPIVGDEQGSTQSNGLGDNDFVYPDAFNPNSLASDSDGPNSLVFSVLSQDDKYLFNGVGNNTGDPVDPGASGHDIINDADAGEVNPDANNATVTIRNQDLSPLGNDGNNAEPGATGILPGETSIVTLVASDGASTTEKDFVVYTDNNGVDRISGQEEGDEVLNLTWTGSSPGDWRFFNEFAAFGTVTSSVNNALCMESTLTGINGAEWFSPYGEPGGIDLVANSIYQFRFNFSTNAATVGATPLYALILDNTDPDDGFGALNLYNQENFRLDNLGGANAPLGGSFGVAEHEFWFTPPPIETAEWNSGTDGVFTAGTDALNDMRIRWRIFDVDGGGWGAETDAGRICMNSVIVNRFPWSSRSVSATPYDVQNVTNATHTVTGLVGSTVSFSGGDVTVTPTDGNYEVEIASYYPGDTNNNPNVGGPDIVDNYPVDWISNAIYEVAVGLSAPNQASEDNPVDVYRLGMDGPTQEVITLSAVTASLLGVGMPNQGAAQTYYALVHTGQTTLSNVSEHDRLRPRLDFICTPALSFDGLSTNAGGMTMHSMTVNQISVGGN